VLFLEADGNYTKLVLKENKTLLSGINLGRLSEQFAAEQFLRISRKHIINKDYLKFMNFCKKQCVISANGKEYQLEVSVKLKEIKEYL
jgi:two-component system, LytTR family, response regulator